MNQNQFVCKLRIGGRSYGMRKMPPVIAAPFATRVIKVVSGLLSDPKSAAVLNQLGELVKGDDKGATSIASIENKDAIRIAMTIASLFANINPDEIDLVFAKAFASEVFVNENERLSDESVFHNHFQQFASDYYPVAIWIVWNNVKDFFANIGDGMKAVFQPSNTHPAPIAK